MADPKDEKPAEIPAAPAVEEKPDPPYPSEKFRRLAEAIKRGRADGKKPLDEEARRRSAERAAEMDRRQEEFLRSFTGLAINKKKPEDGQER